MSLSGLLARFEKANGAGAPPEAPLTISSGGACQSYNVIGLVIGFASQTEGCGGGAPIESTYYLALKRLSEAARAKGASGLLFVNFQNRVAVAKNCGSYQQAFEVFAYGTAVNFDPPPAGKVSDALFNEII